jgi:hypothetical protein
MRVVTYRPLPGVGGGGVLPEEHAPLDEFVADVLPYVLQRGAAPKPWLVPPRRVLNSIFAAGEKFAGMSGGAQWDPFEISDEEYATLVAALGDRDYEPSPPTPPEWVTTEADWRTWEDELQRGVPSAPQRELRAAADAASAAYKAAWDEAVREGDALIVVRRWRELLAAQRAVADLRQGDPPGTTDAASRTPDIEAGRRAVEAGLALKAAERIDDPHLMEHWRRELAGAERELQALVGGRDGAVLAKSRAAAVTWQGP